MHKSNAWSEFAAGFMSGFDPVVVPEPERGLAFTAGSIAFAVSAVLSALLLGYIVYTGFEVPAAAITIDDLAPPGME